MKFLTLAFIFLVALPLTLAAAVESSAPPNVPDTLPGDTIYYDGVDHSFMFVAPQGWVVDTTNAYFDGYTAAMFPGNETYFSATKQIMVWVLDLDSLTFDEFITRDSLHLNKTKGILFYDRYPLHDRAHRQKVLEHKFGLSKAIKPDTSKIDTCIVLELSDPGGKSREAMIAYGNAGSEIVVFQLNIPNRLDLGIAQRAFENVLESFRLTK